MEQRKAKRFDVHLPLRLVRNGIRPITGVGETRNMSSGGVLFTSDTRIEIGEPIEYLITLKESGEVHLHCLGKVMRLDGGASPWEEPGQPFQVAATLERYEFVRERG